MDACRTSRQMKSCEESKIERDRQPSLIRCSFFSANCGVKDCKEKGTFVITECYHYVCGGCLHLGEKFYIGGDGTKKTAYVCLVCIQRNWYQPKWTSMESVFSLLEEKSFCMQCISEEAVYRVNCGHLFCLKCLERKEGHSTLQITCKVTNCSKVIKKEEQDYLDRSISELMVWNAIKFPYNQLCHECFREAIMVLRQCNHGYCHSCVQKLKNNPDPGRSTVRDKKVYRCISRFCQTTIAANILDNYSKLLQSKEIMIAMKIELSIQDCCECPKNNKDEIKIRNRSCPDSHIFCKNCLYKIRENANITSSKQNQEMESLVSCPRQLCKTTTPLLYLETIFDKTSGKTCTSEIFLRKATSEKCGKCKQNYACMIRLVCSHGICVNCVKNEMKVKTAYSICNESICQNVIPVTSIIQFLQENFELVALNGLETHLAGYMYKGSIMAEIRSTKSDKQQKHICYEEEDKLTIQAESELHSASVALNGLETNHAGCKCVSIVTEIGLKQQKNTCFEEEEKSTIQIESELHLTTTIINFDGGHCELCSDLAVAEICNCLHKYCLQCIDVLLTSLSADEKSIKCIAKKCETQICKRRLKEFSMTPMVKQKEMLMYFEVKPDNCGIKGCLNQGIVKARNCRHSFCLGCLQKCTPGVKCEGTTCHNLKLPPEDHFKMLITSLLSKTNTKIFPFTVTQIESNTVDDDWTCSCRSKGSLKIVRCGHKMCKDCIKLHELMHDEDNLITIAKCNGLTCKEFFIIPMYGAYVQHNEINASDSGVNQAGLSSKRQNETVSQDGVDGRTITTLQQQTSSKSPETKKKRKLENDIDEREKAEQTRKFDRGKNNDGRKAKSLGLRNVGFSCYRNCILQVLAETPYFLEHLESFLDRLKGSSQEEQNTWIRYLQTVLVGIQTKCTEDHIEELHQFHHEFNKSNPEYREYVQEDCLSFLTTLLNGIQEVQQDKNGTSMNPAGLFSGKWKDIYKCLKCSTEDCYNESEFLYLPLPYKEKKNKKATIGSCLLGLFEKEFVDLFTCTKCGNARMSKEVAIEFFPMILVLQFSKLSEADESNQDRSLRKKANFVQFWDQFNGLTNNELKQKIGKDTLTPYRLFGVVVHWGSESGGHYISFVKRKDRQKWQKCDDSYVCEASLKSVLESNAYLLFYERCETLIE